MGSDSRDASDAGAGRSDSLMVMHLAADRKDAYLISFPRDMYVDIPGYGKNKINAAYSFGGPQLAVATLEDLLHSRMDHVAIIDFDGFIGLTEELGGVTVMNEHASKSRGYTFPAGKITIKGDEALAFVRERYELPNGDLDRAERQRLVVKAILEKGLSPETIRNPAKFTGFVSGRGEASDRRRGAHRQGDPRHRAVPAAERERRAPAAGADQRFRHDQRGQHRRGRPLLGWPSSPRRCAPTPWTTTSSSSRRVERGGARSGSRPIASECVTYTASDDRYDIQPYRRCGRSGLMLPAVSLGFWHNFGDDKPLETQRAVARRAFDLGVTHFDLANNYGPPYGAAEVNAGRILREDFAAYRDELIISTKAGWDMWPGPYGDLGSRKYLTASLDQSLQRLGLDYVDIFYHHRPDPDTPLEETMGALDAAVRAGKALYVGVSSYSPEHTAKAAGILRELGTPLTIHQPSYSMFNRWIETGLLEVCGQEGVGMIAFTALAQGLLTDRYLDGVPADSRAAQGKSLDPDSITEETWPGSAR